MLLYKNIYRVGNELFIKLERKLKPFFNRHEKKMLAIFCKNL